MNSICDTVVCKDIGVLDMKRRGFTLIELMGVIIILGILSMVVFPVISQNIKNQEKKTFESSMYGILQAVKLDLSDDAFKAPRFYTYDNGVLTLKYVNGIQRNEIIKTSGKIKGTGTIFIDKDGIVHMGSICDSKYCGTNEQQNDTIVIVKNDEGEKPSMDPFDPNIKVNGDNPLVIGIGEVFQDPGATATTLAGEDLSSSVVTIYKKNNEVVDKIDTSIEGEYTILYQVTSNEKTEEVARTVKVVEKRPKIVITTPSLQRVKKQVINITVSAGYQGKVQSFKYRINNNSPITVNGKETTFTLSENGTYEIEVTATDTKGYSSTISSGPYLIDTIAPTITVPESTRVKITEVATFDLLKDVVVEDNSSGVTVNSSGELTANLGEQTITYVAIDEAGNTTTKTRTIVVVEADGPILNFSSTSTSDWVKNTSITVTATDASAVALFTYQLKKDGVAQSPVTVNGTTGNVLLNVTGEYQIILYGKDSEGNESTVTSGTYQVDADTPAAPTVGGTSTTWGTTRTITITPPTSKSGIASYEYYVSNTTTIPSASQAATGTTTTTKATITSNGKYVFVRAVNKVGTKGAWTSALNLYVDTASPSIKANATSYTYTKGTNKAVTAFYTATYGISGGTTTCKVGTTTVTNVSTLAPGTHSLVCTATSGAKKSASVTIKVIVNQSELLIHFDATTDLNYFTLSSNSNASVSVANSYLTESSTRTDNSINVVLTPAKAGMTDFSYIEFKMKKTAATSGVFPHLRIWFADGNEFIYVLMNNFAWSGYTSWWGKALYQNNSSSLWGFSSSAYFCYGDPGVTNDYEVNCRTNGSGKSGAVCSALSHTNEAVYSVTINKSTGAFTLSNGYCNTTVTTPALTTSKITKVDFNFQDDWFNTGHSSMIDYIKVKQ